MSANEIALHDVESSNFPNVSLILPEDGSSSSEHLPATSKNGWLRVFGKSCCKLWYE